MSFNLLQQDGEPSPVLPVLQGLDEKKKERFIKKIHDQGVSVRQLSRLTGTTKGKVEKFLKP